ncbi:hypothetical protein C0J52_08605 [Blattella germanica]|nr:hypothetical protein C0J52_08605 [Blattella germanica]
MHYFQSREVSCTKGVNGNASKLPEVFRSRFLRLGFFFFCVYTLPSVLIAQN